MAKKYQVIGSSLDGSDLPEVSADDNGKVLKVVEGKWKPDVLPILDDVHEASEEDIENMFR